MNNYEKIETYFDELLNLLQDDFTISELNEVVEFIEHGEYGLSIETVVGIIVEKNKKITHRSFILIENLFVLMELVHDSYFIQLVEHIKTT